MTPRQMLKKCRVFESLTDSQIENIRVSSKECIAGGALFKEGDEANDLYIVESGRVALQMQLPVKDGQMSKRVTVDIVSNFELLGWSALVDPRQYTLTAVCLEPTRVLVIDGTHLKNVLRTNHEIGHEVMGKLIQVVASRLDETRRVLVSERLVSS